MRAQLNGEVARQMQRRGLGGGVAEGRVFAERADADAGDGGGDDDAGGVLDAGAFAEQGRESAVLS